MCSEIVKILHPGWIRNEGVVKEKAHEVDLQDLSLQLNCLNSALEAGKDLN